MFSSSGRPHRKLKCRNGSMIHSYVTFRMSKSKLGVGDTKWGQIEWPPNDDRALRRISRSNGTGDGPDSSAPHLRIRHGHVCIWEEECTHNFVRRCWIGGVVIVVVTKSIYMIYSNSVVFVNDGVYGNTTFSKIVIDSVSPNIGLNIAVRMILNNCILASSNDIISDGVGYVESKTIAIFER